MDLAVGNRDKPQPWQPRQQMANAARFHTDKDTGASEKTEPEKEDITHLTVLR